MVYRKLDIPLLFSAKCQHKPLPSYTVNMLLKSWAKFNKQINYFYLPVNGFIGEVNSKQKVSTIHSNATFCDNHWATSRCDLYKGYLTKFQDSQVLLCNTFPVSVSPNMAYLGPYNMENAIKNVFRIYHPSSNSYLPVSEMSCKNMTFIISQTHKYTLSKVQEKWTSLLDFSPNNTWNFFKNLKIRKKIKEFYYKIYSNALPVMNNLKFLDKKCPMCNQEETVTHLLYNCPAASDFISVFSKAIHHATGHLWSFNEKEWFNGLTPTPYMNILILIAKWCIWLNRCNTAYESRHGNSWNTFLFELDKLQQSYNAIPANIACMLHTFSL